MRAQNRSPKSHNLSVFSSSRQTLHGSGRADSCKRSRSIRQAASCCAVTMPWCCRYCWRSSRLHSRSFLGTYLHEERHFKSSLGPGGHPHSYFQRVEWLIHWKGVRRVMAPLTVRHGSGRRGGTKLNCFVAALSRHLRLIAPTTA